MKAGRRKALTKQLAQIVLATAAGLAWMAAPAHADDPAPSSGSIYDGQWSCEFRDSTDPGGFFGQTITYDLIQNSVFVAVKSSFQVDKNGSFSWEERKNSRFHDDSSFIPKNGGPFIGSASYDREAILKVVGQVIDTKTRTLKVTVDHEFGSGRFTGLGGGGTITLSADESSETWIFSIGPPATRVHAHILHVWELKPVSIEGQDLGPDQQREIVTYKASRGIKPPVETNLGDGNFSTEHIEIRQVRELKLVPRG